MKINVQISLGPDEYASDLSGNATELAASILETVGGDPAKDIASVSISDSGVAGNISPPAPLPE
jgi:hypothetical protein